VVFHELGHHIQKTQVPESLGSGLAMIHFV
jgi:hypothetical protein